MRECKVGKNISKLFYFFVIVRALNNVCKDTKLKGGWNEILKESDN